MFKRFLTILTAVSILILISSCEQTTNVLFPAITDATPEQTTPETPGEITDPAETDDVDPEPFEVLPLYIDGEISEQTATIWHNSQDYIDSGLIEAYIPVALEWKENNCWRRLRGRSQKLIIRARSESILDEVLSFINETHSENLAQWRSIRHIATYAPTTFFELQIYPNCNDDEQDENNE